MFWYPNAEIENTPFSFILGVYACSLRYLFQNYGPNTLAFQIRPHWPMLLKMRELEA